MKTMIAYDGSRRHAYEPLGDVCETVQSFYGTGGGNVPIILVYENHSQDTRYKELGDICQTVSETFGKGGNNTPFVVEIYDTAGKQSEPRDGS